MPHDNPWNDIAKATYRQAVEKAFKHMDACEDLGEEATPDLALMFCACFVSMSVTIGADEDTTIEMARSMFKDFVRAQNR